LKHELSAAEKHQLDALRDALDSNLNSQAKFELLAFWARHPSGRTSRGAISPHSSVSREELNEALQQLAAAGVVEISDGTGIRFYGLAKRHPAYAAILQLGKLTPKRRRYLMRTFAPNPNVDSSPRRLIAEREF